MGAVQTVVQAFMAEQDQNAIIAGMQALGEGINQVTQAKFGASLDQIAQDGGAAPGGAPPAGGGAPAGPAGPPPGPPAGAVGPPV